MKRAAVRGNSDKYNIKEMVVEANENFQKFIKSN
jgi:hypothetical protein